MAGVSEQRETILVCFAVKAECWFFKPPSGTHLITRVCCTGMGRQNAVRTVRQELDAALPGFLLSSGFAGGLNPGLARNTVVFASDDELRLTPALLKAGAVSARFHCSPQIVTKAEQKRKLWQTTGADAVEMESEVIRQLCRERSVPSATIRVISDAANDDLPVDFNALLTSDSKLSYFKLASALMRSPGKISGLVRLRRDANAAAAALAKCLEAAIACFQTS